MLYFITGNGNFEIPQMYFICIIKHNKTSVAMLIKIEPQILKNQY